MKDFLFILRILKRNPLSFFVNVIGLGVALTTVILTLTYIRYEQSYDNHFSTRDRVVRLYSRVVDNTSLNYYGISLRNAYTQIPSKVPEVECAVQLYGGWPSSVQYRETKMNSIRTFYSDKEFFKVFGQTLLWGDANTALLEKNTAVITTSLARKLFGGSNCVGKDIDADGKKVMITGVMNELPKNSHLTFDILISLSTLNPQWFGGLEFQTYFLFKPNVDLKAASAKIAAVNNILMKDWSRNMNAKVQSGVEPLANLYLHSAASSFIPNHGNPKQMLIIELIALFVLLTAVLSYINLFILHGEKRITEISTRNLFGATKLSIARLFFMETSIVFLIAAALALLATYKLMPGISNLLMSKMGISDLFSGWGILSIILVLITLLLVTSGYPVFYLSRMKYALGLRGKLSGTGNNNRFSIASVFIQFAVTTFFISCVVIIISQLNFMHNIPLGFDKNNVTAVINCSSSISKKYESIRSELLELPFVSLVSGGEHMMGGGCSGQLIRTTWDSEKNEKTINEYRERPGFCELMRFQLVDGRFFRESMADSNAIVLNESAIKLLGIKPKAGQTVSYKDKRVEVLGVVRDFYYESNPGELIKPLVISNCFYGTPYIYIRSKEPLKANQMDQVKAVFRNFDKNYIFESRSVSDIFNSMYLQENRLAQMVSIGSAQLAIISLISLLALTILKISRRTKEIGIRKVNGSSVAQVISVLLKETVITVAIASLIASVASFIIMNKWLSDYALRIHLNPGYFLLTIFFILLIAIGATIWQAWRAAARNPVETLRYE
jgi:putative ABC transport system permease protein